MLAVHSWDRTTSSKVAFNQKNDNKCLNDCNKTIASAICPKKDNKNRQQILDNDNITVERQGIFAKTKYVLDNLLTHNVFFQGLHSNDQRILSSVLDRADPDLIDNTVSRSIYNNSESSHESTFLFSIFFVV